MTGAATDGGSSRYPITLFDDFGTLSLQMSDRDFYLLSPLRAGDLAAPLICVEGCFHKVLASRPSPLFYKTEDGAKSTVP